jgi:hypothetical protein
VEQRGLHMPHSDRSIASRLWGVVKVVWTVSIIVLAIIVGAAIGWNTHGIAGALALGFVGFVAGVFLSSPQFLLQILS